MSNPHITLPFTSFNVIGRPTVTAAGKTKEVFLSATAGPYKKKSSGLRAWARPTR